MKTVISYVAMLCLFLACSNDVDLMDRADFLKGEKNSSDESPGTEYPCEVDPLAPECIAFCEIYPDHEDCQNTVDCNETPDDPACLEFCEKFPFHASCTNIDYCVEYPDSPECQAYCIAHPDDSVCSEAVDCNETPDDPACMLYCEIYPFDPVCDFVEIIGFGSVGGAFEQIKVNNKVDIVWVVDNSGSMENEQSSMAENFDNFISTFVTRNIDYKIGITTTDTGGTGSVFEHNGEFQGAEPVLSSSMDQAYVKNNFISNINVGISGSGRERGLEASKMAIEKNSDPSSNNYQFLRDEAILAVIIVSDENDISSNSTESYVNFLSGVKNVLSDIAVYPIVDTTSQSYPDPYYTPVDMDLYLQDFLNPGGARYLTTCEKIGGFSADIDDEFSTTLLNIGSGIADLLSRFPLENVPMISSIKLRVDGAYIPHSSSDGWKYDIDTNSIVFKGSYVPEVNAVVEVSYKHFLYEYD